ncbi:MAG: TolC family protein [Myxococcales bacterium]|nr:TolC family protein [Myxococcales bacterium]
MAALMLLMVSHAAQKTWADPRGGPAEGSVMDLESLSLEAERRSANLQAARHTRMAAEAQLDEARLSPFFQFQAEGGLAVIPDATGVPGYTRDSPNQLTRGFGPAIQGRVKGAIPVWTFGKLSAAREAAGHGVKGAEHNLERVRQQLLFDVRRAYFGLQLALDAEQMLSEGLPKLEKAQTKLKQRLADGDAEVEPADGYRLATTVAEVAARSSEVRRLERSTRLALSILAGKSRVRVPDCPSKARAHTPKSLSWYQTHARNNRPELGMLRAGIGARKADLAAKRAKYFPDLAIGLDLQSQYIPGRTAWAHYDPYFVGGALIARWELDFVGHSSRERRAEHQLLEAEAQQELARQGILLDVGEKYERLTDADRRLSAWKDGHMSARRWFVSAAQGHQVGTTTTRELIDGVSAYFKARFAHLQAVHDHNAALAALELAVGAPLLTRDEWNLRCDDGFGAE